MNTEMKLTKVSKSFVTRASRKESLSTIYKSDHVVDKNQVNRWGKAKVILARNKIGTESGLRKLLKSGKEGTTP